MRRAVEFRAGPEGAGMHKKMRQELLDDRKRLACHAQIYLGAGMVGDQAQIFEGREIQP